MSDSPELWPDDDRPSDRPGGTDILTEERVAPVSTDEGDHEKFSHFVKKDKIVESAVLGSAVVALCGKVWVPSRDPQKFPVCPECKEIWESLPRGGGGDDNE
jgi:hypothetical protein